MNIINPGLYPGSVTTDDLANASVTSVKIADSAVTATKVLANEVQLQTSPKRGLNQTIAQDINSYVEPGAGELGKIICKGVLYNYSGTAISLVFTGLSGDDKGNQYTEDIKTVSSSAVGNTPFTVEYVGYLDSPNGHGLTMHVVPTLGILDTFSYWSTCERLYINI